MRGLVRNILTAAIIVASFVSAATAEGEETLRKPPMGSLARQLLLKHNLEAVNSGKLAGNISHNRAEWENLSPEERDKYRNQVLRFIAQSSSEDIEKIIKYHDRLLNMSLERQEAYRQREKWLKVVVASFTPQERENLQKLSPDERAKILLERKAELIKAGKLPPDAPAKTEAAPAARPEDTSSLNDRN